MIELKDPQADRRVITEIAGNSFKFCRTGPVAVISNASDLLALVEDDD